MVALGCVLSGVGFSVSGLRKPEVKQATVLILVERGR